MTLGTTQSTVTVDGNGVTTTFTYNFPIPAASDAVVVYTNTSGQQAALTSTQYVITGLGSATGGTVTYPVGSGVTPIPAGSTLTISRKLALIQTTSISSQGPTFAAIESELDYQMMCIQQVSAQAGSALTGNPTDPPGLNYAAPPVSGRAGLVMGWDSQGNVIAGASASGALVSSAMIPVVEAASTFAAAGQMAVASVFQTIASLRLNSAAPLSGQVVYVAGYRAGADGGEGNFWYDASDTTSSDNGGTVIVDLGGRRWHREVDENVINLLAFGYVADNSTDNTAAINNAINTGLCLTLPPGTGLTAGGHTLAAVGQTIGGIGNQASTIDCTSGTAHVFTFGTNSVGLANMVIGRTVAGSSNASGVYAPSAEDQTITYVKSTGHVRGFWLGTTDASLVTDAFAYANTGDGFYFQNTGTYGPLQWTMVRPRSEENGGRGYTVESAAGASQVTMNPWYNVDSFANTGGGVAWIENGGVKINDIRILGGYFGFDGFDEISPQISGANIQISDVFIEYTGTGTTGPGMGTAASNQGGGIALGGSIQNALIVGARINNCSDSGIGMSAGSVTIDGSEITNCGAAGASGNQFGVNCGGGTLLVNGLRAGNFGGATSQQYAVGIGASVSGGNVALVGCNFLNNASGPIENTSSTGAQVTILGCLPISTTSQLPGALAVGQPTGTTPSQGINTEGGVALNGTLYTNP